MLSSGNNLSAFERNRFFLNQEGNRFVDLSHESNSDIDSDSRGAIVGDFNRDGSPDLLVSSVGGGPLRLFENQIPGENHRVRIDLEGVESNRPAIGSRVTIICNRRLIVRDLFPANGFMGQSPPELNIGLGNADKIDTLTIRWPNGETQTFHDLPVDGRLKFTEGKAEFEVNSFRGTAVR